MAQSLTHKYFSNAQAHTLKDPVIKPVDSGYSPVVTPTSVPKPYLKNGRLVVPMRVPGMYQKRPK